MLKFTDVEVDWVAWGYDEHVVHLWLIFKIHSCIFQILQSEFMFDFFNYVINTESFLSVLNITRIVFIFFPPDCFCKVSLKAFHSLVFFGRNLNYISSPTHYFFTLLFSTLLLLLRPVMSLNFGKILSRNQGWLESCLIIWSDQDSFALCLCCWVHFLHSAIIYLVWIHLDYYIFFKV